MTSLNSILDANPELKKKADVAPAGPAPGFSDFTAALSKMGQRHGKKDKAILQKAHDAMAELVGGVNCAMDDDTAKAAAAALEKSNARHSKKDLEEIKKVHDMIHGLGADCPGKKETSE